MAEKRTANGETINNAFAWLLGIVWTFLSIAPGIELLAPTDSWPWQADLWLVSHGWGSVQPADRWNEFPYIVWGSDGLGVEAFFVKFFFYALGIALIYYLFHGARKGFGAAQSE